jgi:hypothetical protein
MITDQRRAYLIVPDEYLSTGVVERLELRNFVAEYLFAIPSRPIREVRHTRSFDRWAEARLLANGAYCNLEWLGEILDHEFRMDDAREASYAW